MLENHIHKLLGARTYLIGTICIAFCLALSGCGGGGGAEAACVSALGALGANACKNGTTNKSSTTSTSILKLDDMTVGLNEGASLTTSLLNTTNLTGVTFVTVPGMGPSSGTLTLDATTGAFTYTPSNIYWWGSDSFLYYVKDASGQSSNQAKVTITVSKVAISATAYTQYTALNPFQVAQNGSNTHGLLTSTNPNQDQVVYFISNPTTTQGGTATTDIYGNFIYSPPNAVFTGTDHFVYSVQDNATNSTSTATVYINVTANSNAVTWVSDGILGVYNNFAQPNAQNVNVTVQATCANVGTSPTYSKGLNWPTTPVLNLNTSTGAITGALAAAPGSVAVSTPIPVNVSCPTGGGTPTSSSKLFEMYVLPTTVVQLSTTATIIAGGQLGSGSCTTSTTLLANCVTYLTVSGFVTGPVTLNSQYIYSVTPPTGVTAMSALIVGGGGGGAAGSTSASGAGGGGGGFMSFNNNSIPTVSAFPVYVGLGGIAGTVLSPTGQAGQPSALNAITALGGLGGTGAGGSGGAEPGSNALSNNTLTTTSFAGGQVKVGTTEGGGGGADGVGNLPAGGYGAPSNITGSTVYYSAGGAGGSLSSSCTSATTTADGNGGAGGLGGLSSPCPGVAGDPGVVIISF